MDSTTKETILHKEIDLIQACISRMAQNSFLIKGWYFSIIVVISAFKTNSFLYYSLLVLLVTVVFYFINMQFYIYEREFRDLYYARINLRGAGDYATDMYSLKISNRGNMRQRTKSLFKYIFENKMLLFTYFSICILLIIFKWLDNDGSVVEKTLVEIQGLINIKN